MVRMLDLANSWSLLSPPSPHSLPGGWLTSMEDQTGLLHSAACAKCQECIAFRMPSNGTWVWLRTTSNSNKPGHRLDLILGPLWYRAWLQISGLPFSTGLGNIRGIRKVLWENIWEININVYERSHTRVVRCFLCEHKAIILDYNIKAICEADNNFDYTLFFSEYIRICIRILRYSSQQTWVFRKDSSDYTHFLKSTYSINEVTKHQC